jgi:hypothetical protein
MQTSWNGCDSCSWIEIGSDGGIVSVSENAKKIGNENDDESS